MQNILVVGAHFDDAELGCGGTMAKLAAEGKKVYKLTMTDNVTNFIQMDIHVDLESSRVGSALACKELGVEEITDFELLECNHLVYNTEIMQKVEKIIFDRKIDTVFMHFDSDMNQDHIATSKICLTAARHCKNILYYQSNGFPNGKTIETYDAFGNMLRSERYDGGELTETTLCSYIGTDGTISSGIESEG